MLAGAICSQTGRSSLAHRFPTSGPRAGPENLPFRMQRPNYTLPSLLTIEGRYRLHVSKHDLYNEVAYRRIPILLHGYTHWTIILAGHKLLEY